MTPRQTIIPDEYRQCRTYFILGAYIRLGRNFVLSTPAGSPREAFDDCVTATRAYCMGDALDNRAAEAV